ncbi:MAG TPA: O-antigen ligase family protein [Terriglobales bacterium]
MRMRGRLLQASFVIAVLLFSSGAFAPVWTDPAKHDVAGGQWELETAWAIAYVSVAAFLLLHRSLLLGVFIKNKLLLVLLCWAALSAAWSADAAVTLRKFAALFGSALFGVAVALRFRLREQAMLVAVSMAIAAAISVAISLYDPAMFPSTEQAVSSWNGIFSHKNVLGRSMAFGAIAFLAWPRRSLPSWAFSLGGFALCGFLIIRSHSQTAMLVTLCALVLVCSAPVARWRWRDALGAGTLLLLPATACAAAVASHAESVAAWLQRDLTLTGRARIWELAWLSVERNPLLGYGYSAYWWVSDESYQTLGLLHYATPHAHNGFLDLTLQIGLIGAALFAVVWIRSLFAALRFLRSSADAELWPVLFLSCLLLYSFTENALMIPNSLLWIMFVAVAVGLSREMRREGAHARA